MPRTRVKTLPDHSLVTYCHTNQFITESTRG